MLNKLIHAISNKGYVYTLLNLHQVEVEFAKFVARIVIMDDKYRVYIFDCNTNEIVKHKDYKYTKCITNFILDNWLEFNQI